MSDFSPNLTDALWATTIKIWPGIMGSLASLRFMPKESTWGDRATSLITGVIIASYLGPGIAEITGVDSEILRSSITLLAGLFSMTVIGELIATIKEVGLPAILRDTLRKFMRLER